MAKAFEICFDNLKGRCHRGDACRFSHDGGESAGRGDACYECGEIGHFGRDCPIRIANGGRVGPLFGMGRRDDRGGGRDPYGPGYYGRGRRSPSRSPSRSRRRRRRDDYSDSYSDDSYDRRRGRKKSRRRRRDDSDYSDDDNDRRRKRSSRRRRYDDDGSDDEDRRRSRRRRDDVDDDEPSAKRRGEEDRPPKPQDSFGDKAESNAGKLATDEDKDAEDKEYRRREDNDRDE